jgi:hypothetical protein
MEAVYSTILPEDGLHLDRNAWSESKQVHVSWVFVLFTHSSCTEQPTSKMSLVTTPLPNYEPTGVIDGCCSELK